MLDLIIAWGKWINCLCGIIVLICVLVGIASDDD